MERERQVSVIFSNNGKISAKQRKRSLMLSIFASIIFILPYLSANLFGESVVVGLLVFLIMAGIYILCLDRLGACCDINNKKGFLTSFDHIGLPGKLVLCISLTRQIMRLSFYILITIAVLEEGQVPFMLKTKEPLISNLLVVLPLLVIAFYGAKVGVENHGRINELIFWFLFLPFALLLLFGLKEVDYQIFIPHNEKKIGTLLLYAYAMLPFVLPAEYDLYLRPHLAKGQENNKNGLAMFGIVGLSVFLTLFILGIYGIQGAKSDVMATIGIMRYIRLPFGLLERIDVLMICFFMIGCFVLISHTLFFGGYLWSKGKEEKQSAGLLVFMLIAAVAVVLWARSLENGLLVFLCYGAVIDVPLSLLLPLLSPVAKSMEKEESE